MKIAIVGGGISGLSTYLFLRSRLPPPPPSSPPHSIILYETYPAPRRATRAAHSSPTATNPDLPSSETITAGRAALIGGGLGIGPNGMRTLLALSRDIHDAVVAQGYPVARFQINSARGWTIGSMPAVDAKRFADVDSGKVPEMMVMSTRQGVWDCLREHVPDEDVISGRTVARVVTRGEGEGEESRPVLVFTDGEREEVDLIVGADGVRSVVKKAVVGDGLQDQYPPDFKGLVGIGGFVSSSAFPPVPSKMALSAPNSPVVMTFGPNGFFGYGPCSTAPGSSALSASDVAGSVALPLGPQGMWWSSFHADEPPPEGASKNLDEAAARRGLMERHGDWKDPVIAKLVKEGDVSLGTATWVTPKLPTWAKGGVVLVGDAAHALPSTSGQGASCALEDAHCLALLLKHHLSRAYSTPSEATNDEDKAVDLATSAYVMARKSRVERILDNANRIGDRKGKKGVVAEWVTYFMMWLLCRFFSGIMMRDLDYSVEAEVERVIKLQEKR